MLSKEEIMELAYPYGEFQYGDAQGDKRMAFARGVERRLSEKQFVGQTTANKLYILSNELAGVLIDCSESGTFDEVCRDTVARVRRELLSIWRNSKC